MQARGFTLIEFVVAMAVLAVLLSVAVPALDGTVRQHRVVSDINRLNAAMQGARSAAIQSGASTVVCPSADGRRCVAETWEVGWLSFVDVDGTGVCDADLTATHCSDGGRILGRGGVLSDGTLRANGNARWRVRYDAHGRASGYAATFSRCSADGATRAGFTLIMTGRLRRLDAAQVECGTP